MNQITVTIPLEEFNSLKNREAELLKKIEDLYEAHNKELDGFKNGDNTLIIDYGKDFQQYFVTNNSKVLKELEGCLDFAIKNNRSFWKKLLT